MENLDKILSEAGPIEVAGAPEGFDAIFVATLARRAGTALHVARDDARLAAMTESVRYFDPDLKSVAVPAWDCLPFDRVSPNPELASRRMAALGALAGRHGSEPLLVITTINALLQRVPPRDLLVTATFAVTVGDRLEVEQLVRFLEGNGYSRTGTVMEAGEFAVRGGLVDIFPPGQTEPVRIDMFGDSVDGMRRFDPLTQRTTAKEKELRLGPVSEVMLDQTSINRFRGGYRQHFGTVTDGDPLYESVSEGRKHVGMEHWLPLFQDRLETLFDFLPDSPVLLDRHIDEARAARLEQIAEYYDNRVAARKKAFGDLQVDYKPLPPGLLYLDEPEWEERLAGRAVCRLNPFAVPDSDRPVFEAGGRPGRDFAPERSQGRNVYEALHDHAADLVGRGRQLVVASYSAGARERLALVLADHGLAATRKVESWQEALNVEPSLVPLIVLGLERGFETDQVAVVGEQDLLGDRLVRPRRGSRHGEAALTEAASLSTGDYVVHFDHGIGRYEGLQTLDITGAPHDCLLVVYDGGDKLFVPVENIEVLSRFGGDSAQVALDRLGGTAWQARKARAKKRIRDMADVLIRIAAERALRQGQVMTPPEGLYDEFCARFPYAETEDQMRAIEDVVTDLGSGRPMDRLVCGDVGFGKTEVALRSAVITAMAGQQVAVVAPTTLLSRQHFQTFSERFRGLPIKIGQLSRMVSTKEANAVSDGIKSGDIDVAIGTHALLGKAVKFRDLGLLVIDEEQHFGVAHKERLKQMRADVHVLTLTATPIPRTLQMALSGVRELSLIATAPVDRLAIRTFVLPFDPVVVREALLREHFRGGQSFYVCPRIADLPEAEAFLAEHVPEVKVAKAHGRLPARELDQVMNAFYNGAFDVLLCTNIVESGLDIPSANTLVVHRADMFGLSQLYQIRGRIGRSKIRAYAYLTVPPRKRPTAAAEKRLRVLQALDSLGAGFSLASHDLDIRGAGNLLGEEQSGHIREVGYELYQELLEEAVAQARGGTALDEADDRWSPQINLGTAVLIPDTYVEDLSLRLELYRRVARLDGREEVDAFAAELIDRFGPLPAEVEHLLDVVVIKGFCRRAGIDKVEAGPRGATLSFRNNNFANPAGLVQFISKQAATAKLRPDHRLVYRRHWDTAQQRQEGVRHLVRELAKIADVDSV